MNQVNLCSFFVGILILKIISYLVTYGLNIFLLNTDKISFIWFAYAFADGYFLPKLQQLPKWISGFIETYWNHGPERLFCSYYILNTPVHGYINNNNTYLHTQVIFILIYFFLILRVPPTVRVVRSISMVLDTPRTSTMCHPTTCNTPHLLQFTRRMNGRNDSTPSSNKNWNANKQIGIME